MAVQTAITLDTKKLNDALARFPRDRAMQIGGREAHASGEMIERRSPAHGVVVTRVPRGRAEDARAAIAAARAAFDEGPWPNATASNRARVLLNVADLIDRDRELATSTPPLESGAASGPAPYGSTRSWTAHRSCHSAATASPASAASSGATRSKITPRKRHFMSIPARERLGGPAWSLMDEKNREPINGSWIRGRPFRREQRTGRVRA